MTDDETELRYDAPTPDVQILDAYWMAAESSRKEVLCSLLHEWAQRQRHFASAVNGRCQHCGRHLETVGTDATRGRCVLRGCPRVGEWQAIASGLHPTQLVAQREHISRQLRPRFEVA